MHCLSTHTLSAPSRLPILCQGEAPRSTAYVTVIDVWGKSRPAEMGSRRMKGACRFAGVDKQIAYCLPFIWPFRSTSLSASDSRFEHSRYHPPAAWMEDARARPEKGRTHLSSFPRPILPRSQDLTGPSRSLMVHLLWKWGGEPTGRTDGASVVLRGVRYGPVWIPLLWRAWIGPFSYLDNNVPFN